MGKERERDITNEILLNHLRIFFFCIYLYRRGNPPVSPAPTEYPTPLLVAAPMAGEKTSKRANVAAPVSPMIAISSKFSDFLGIVKATRATMIPSIKYFNAFCSIDSSSMIYMIEIYFSPSRGKERKGKERKGKERKRI
jgi:hypothetical protein